MLIVFGVPLNCALSATFVSAFLSWVSGAGIDKAAINALALNVADCSWPLKAGAVLTLVASIVAFATKSASCNRDRLTEALSLAWSN